MGGGNPPTKTSAPPTRKSRPRNSQIVKWSIPEATNGRAERLIVDVPVHIAIAGVQVVVPGVVAAALSCTPEPSDVSNTAETTSDMAITTWESGETA